MVQAQAYNVNKDGLIATGDKPYKSASHFTSTRPGIRAHLGQHNYVSFPVNAYEAESRRLARFFRHGHTPGRIQTCPFERNLDFPFTLDLRNV